MKNLTWIALAVAGLLNLSTAHAASNGMPMNEFHPVSPGIYRGSRPETQGMVALAKAGIRTDLNLEDARDVVAAEKTDAARLGMRFISMPMSGFWTPNDAEVGQILKILNDSSNYPIYVHCQHGHDRTGLIVGLYRVFYEHWSPAAAYHEMLQMGFHPALVFLNHYYEEKTGYEDIARPAVTIPSGAQFRRVE